MNGPGATGHAHESTTRLERRRSSVKDETQDRLRFGNREIRGEWLPAVSLLTLLRRTEGTFSPIQALGTGGLI